MILEFINVVLEIFVQYFEIVSALIIIYGGLRTIFRILRIEVFKKPGSYQRIRKEFTDRILLGLELLIIADVLETLRRRSLDDILLLGAIILIRILLSHFLSKEEEEYNFD
jgi:uncharacterized membrane protein